MPALKCLSSLYPLPFPPAPGRTLRNADYILLAPSCHVNVSTWWSMFWAHWLVMRTGYSHRFSHTVDRAGHRTLLIFCTLPWLWAGTRCAKFWLRIAISRCLLSDCCDVSSKRFKGVISLDSSLNSTFSALGWGSWFKRVEWPAQGHSPWKWVWCWDGELSREILESDPQDSTVLLGFDDVLTQCPDRDNILIIALYSGNL